MIIDGRSWHAKVYYWFYRKTKESYAPETPPRANLCPYVRTVILWAPMFFLFGAVKYVRAVTWGLVLGTSLPFLTLGCGWAVTAGLYAYAIAVVALISWPFGERPVLSLAARPPSKFSKVLKGYIRATHDRICPEIEFVDFQ